MNSINTTDIAVTSSPGADISGLTLILMCQLFGFMKEWLQERDISKENATIYDNDTVVQQERMFSGRDCERYHLSTWWSPGECVDNSNVLQFEPHQLTDFTNCITTHFMTGDGSQKQLL